MKILKQKLLIFIVFLVSSFLFGQDNETCLECHSDPDLTAERGSNEISMYIDKSILEKSAHEGMECIDCHPGAAVEDFPHEERLAPVKCGECHEDPQVEFDAGIHSYALKQKLAYAPDCRECHGTHNILSSKNRRSPIYKMQIPFLCGKCHKEGAPVARVYNITEHNILENYSQSIHGEGLFKKGLTVTATCIDCHRSHKILPHTDKNSSISPRNVAATCMACHGRIEDVHVKVIKGERWEKDPGAIPACTDCHLPHKARKASLTLNVSDRACLNCHEKEGVHKIADGRNVSLFVAKEELSSSIHQEVTCVKCHSDVNPRLHRPCETAKNVDCSSCHTRYAEEYNIGGHGTAYAQGNKHVPFCTDCHGHHDVKSHLDETSKTYRESIPNLCGECHSKDSKLEETMNLSQTNAFFDYSESIHGQKLTEKGLLPSAVCSDCHSAHMVLNHEDPRSFVYRKNIPATCATCHRGIYKDFTKSIHFSTDERHTEQLPTCTDCHHSHKIGEVGQDKFITEITQQCGSCHKDLSKTYLETMHGKAYNLGYLKSAKCSDCHNSHKILAVTDPNSSVGRKNIVTTCKQCHEDANLRFTGYLTHATHHDPVKYPILYYTYWAMTILLISVFSFFGIHTILWMPRSFRSLKQRKKHKESPNKKYIKRFELPHRIMHLFVIVSFMSLALTGMMLKFSGMAWAAFLANLLGGVHVAGLIHRFAAVITFGYFFTHIYILIKKKRRARATLKDFIFGPNSMMFNKKDFKDFWATIKWFVGLGPRPDYGRWTYWEKFDYFAVFWGVAIIGFSGLMLWFPEFFTQFVPGWLINVATIIHSDEALLAVGFIFTIHFFNTHLRPEAFPMDQVIFTGRVLLEEYIKDRPHEYEFLKKSGELKKRITTTPFPERWEKFVYILGFTFLSFGVLLVLLIIYSMVFGYKL